MLKDLLRKDSITPALSARIQAAIDDPDTSIEAANKVYEEIKGSLSQADRQGFDIKKQAQTETDETEKYGRETAFKFQMKDSKGRLYQATNETVAKDMRNRHAAFAANVVSFNEIKAIVGENGEHFPDKEDDQSALKSAWVDIAMQAKNSYALGVLSESDSALIADAIGLPVSTFMDMVKNLGAAVFNSMILKSITKVTFDPTSNKRSFNKLQSYMARQPKVLDAMVHSYSRGDAVDGGGGPPKPTATYPKLLKKDGKEVPINNAEDEAEARKDGWQ